MDWDLTNIVTPPPIMGVTINTVSLSPAFREILYYIIPCLFVICVVLFSLFRGSGFARALRSSLITVFFSAGLLYAAHADTGWGIWLAGDAHNFAGLDTNAKLSRLEGGIADFSRAAAKVLGPEYMLFSSDGYLALRAEYFLLPLRKRERADDIVVIADTMAGYDPATHTFMRGDIKIEHVDPLLVFAKNAYVLRRRTP